MGLGKVPSDPGGGRGRGTPGAAPASGRAPLDSTKLTGGPCSSGCPFRARGLCLVNAEVKAMPAGPSELQPLGQPPLDQDGLVLGLQVQGTWGWNPECTNIHNNNQHRGTLVLRGELTLQQMSSVPVSVWITKPTKCVWTLGLLTPLPSFLLAENFRWCGAAFIASRNERPSVLALFVVAAVPCLCHLLLC